MNQALLINLNNGQEYVINSDTTIGRAGSNDIVLNDPGLASTHARILYLGYGWYVSAENAAAGVELNGFRVPSEGRLGLRPGCQLKMGDTVLQFTTDPALIEQALARQPQPQARHIRPTAGNNSPTPTPRSGAGYGGPTPKPRSGAGYGGHTSTPQPAPGDTDPTPTPRRKKKWGWIVGILVVAAAAAGLCLAFFLTDGFKSREVRELEQQIGAIGQVNLDSETELLRAREAYNRLSPKDAARVENIGTLDAAESQYETLLYQKAAAEFDQAVEDLGTVGLQSESDIAELRERYRSMDEQVKAFVTREGPLTEAETRLQQLKEQDAAEKLDQQFRSIGEVTLESESRIKQARNAYSQASPEVKKLVRDLAILEEAERTYQKLVEDRDFEAAMELYSAGDLENYLLKAQAFLKSYPKSEHAEELGGNCVSAYLKISKDQENQGLNEAALKTLEACEKQNFQGDDGRTEEALQTLRDKLESKRPGTGHVLDGYCRGGYCLLIVQNGAKDALIKVESTSDPENVYMSFYVRANETAKLDIKDGSYTFKYATGDTWFGLKELFGENTSYNKADKILTFETTYKGNYVYYSERTITLYTVLGGNMSTTPIGEGDF